MVKGHGRDIICGIHAQIFKKLQASRMLILNVIDNGLACDCGVSRVLIMTYHRFCKKYFS